MKILKKIIVQIISFCYRTVKELKFKDRLSPIDLYMEKQVRDSFEEFSDEMEKAMIFPNRSAMREFAMREFIKLNKVPRFLTSPIYITPDKTLIKPSQCAG